jgi:hypothetical protein
MAHTAEINQVPSQAAEGFPNQAALFHRCHLSLEGKRDILQRNPPPSTAHQIGQRTKPPPKPIGKTYREIAKAGQHPGNDAVQQPIRNRLHGA